jgi:hypothetical protein
MSHQKITDALSNSLPYQDKGTLWLHDVGLAGFNLAIAKTAKTFYAAGEQKRRFIRVKIGRADIIKVAEAQAVARDVLLPEIRCGINPRAKYLGEQDQACARIMTGIRTSDEKARDLLRGKVKRNEDKLTVGQVWDLFEAHCIAALIELKGPAMTVCAPSLQVIPPKVRGCGSRIFSAI